MIMKKCLIFSLIVALLFNCNHTNKKVVMDADYLSMLNQNRELRSENRVKYLELAGLFKLDSISNSFGKAASNRFVLNIDYLPPSIGSIHLSEKGLKFQASKNIKVSTETGDQIESLALPIDAFGNSVQLTYKALKWQVITRSGALYLRVWDSKNPAINAFEGFKSYDINSDFIFDANFSYFETAQQETVASKLGVNEVTNFIGQVHFTYKNTPYSLDIGSQGFLMVGDLTSGETTYGGGRYMYLELPEVDGRLTLDFNYLYNPPCAFSEFTTCLYPPRQNLVPFKIEAGELLEKDL